MATVPFRSWARVSPPSGGSAALPLTYVVLSSSTAGSDEQALRLPLLTLRSALPLPVYDTGLDASGAPYAWHQRPSAAPSARST